MTTNSQLSTTEPKKQKLSKQLEQEQNHRNGDHMEDYQQGGEGGVGEKVQGIRSIKVGTKQTGEVKNNIGNEAVKELICMTHGHELWGGNGGGRGWAGWSGVKGGKWDNCNSIINKYIKRRK